jgi:hypothetical protein
MNAVGIAPCVTISTNSLESLGGLLTAYAAPPGSFSASAAYPLANLALYIPFVVCQRVPVVRLFSNNGGGVSGNIDLGIYDHTGQRLVSTGSTAQAGVSAPQMFTVAVTLGAGRYYLAVAMDNTTGTLRRYNLSALHWVGAGVAEQTSAFPLPATATFATMTRAYMPIIGLSTITTAL